VTISFFFKNSSLTVIFVGFFTSFKLLLSQGMGDRPRLISKSYKNPTKKFIHIETFGEYFIKNINTFHKTRSGGSDNRMWQ